jgi:hypothetical protein
MGDCPVCGAIVCEDEWRIFDDLIMHPRCVPDYVKQKYGMNESQFLRICGAQELRQAIQDTRESFKDSMDFYNTKLQDLEEQLVRIEAEGKT